MRGLFCKLIGYFKILSLEKDFFLPYYNIISNPILQERKRRRN